MALPKTKALLMDRTNIRRNRVAISLLRRPDISKGINSLQTTNRVQAISNHKVIRHSQARINLRQTTNSLGGTSSLHRTISKAILNLATHPIREDISSRKAISNLHKATHLSKQATKAIRPNPASRLKVHLTLMLHHILSPDSLGSLQTNNHLILRAISMVRMDLSRSQMRRIPTQHPSQPQSSLT